MDKFITSSGAIFASVVGGVLIPAYEYLYGNSQVVVSVMTALIFFIAMDWISGTRAAKKDNTYVSKYGIDGIFRTFWILLLPAGGHLLDNILGAPDVIFSMLAFGVLYHTLQSMTANALRAGWGDSFPEWIMTRITDWVKEELESKLQRSAKRKNELGSGE